MATSVLAAIPRRGGGETRNVGASHRVVAVDIAGQPDKLAWRAGLLTRRAAVDPSVHEAESAALAAALTRLPLDAGEIWVAAYAPVRGEPGSTAMLDTLRTIGVRVLLP